MSSKITEQLIDAAAKVRAAYGNCGTPWQQEAAKAMDKAVADARASLSQDMSPGAKAFLIEEARAQYAEGSDDDVEIDDDALFSQSDGGTWVSAWVWVRNAEDDNNG